MIPSVHISLDSLLWCARGVQDDLPPTFSVTPDQTMTDSGRFTERDIERELESHYALVYRYVSGMTWGSGLDAEDLTQDVFLKAYRSADSFNRGSALSTWLYKIARNTVYDAMRKQKVRRFLGLLWPMNDEHEPNDFAQSESDDEQMDVREIQLIVRQAITELDEPYRSLVIWKELEELPYKQIAEITGEPEGTLKSRLFYARKKLRDILLKKGIHYEI
ncbi:MAG: RNA polymerase sigma factor [Bacteroidetes bacterium]|nr:RNA polymerase sigma factor [Bacteroidota bacterium]